MVPVIGIREQIQRPEKNGPEHRQRRKLLAAITPQGRMHGTKVDILFKGDFGTVCTQYYRNPFCRKSIGSYGKTRELGGGGIYAYPR
jgi:hypothetical protein